MEPQSHQQEGHSERASYFGVATKNKSEFSTSKEILNKDDYRDADYENETNISDGDEKEDEGNDDDDENSKSIQKPFKCSICSAGFIYEGYLKKHIDVHGLFFSYKMLFEYDFNVITWILGPDGSLIVKCTCCRFYFASAIEMKEHRFQNHMNEIKCQFCDKVFTCPYETRKHIQTKHKINTRLMHFHECSKCGNFFYFIRYNLLFLSSFHCLFLKQISRLEIKRSSTYTWLRVVNDFSYSNAKSVALHSIQTKI